VRQGQGYLFAKPVAVAQLPAVIAAAARFTRDDAEPDLFEAPRIAMAG